MNEFEAAFALSQLNAREDDDRDGDHISKLVDSGRFVIVAEYPRYCRITDALIGSGKSMYSHHATREEANAALPQDDEDVRYFVFPIEKCPEHPTEDRHSCDCHGLSIMANLEGVKEDDEVNIPF